MMQPQTRFCPFALMLLAAICISPASCLAAKPKVDEKKPAVPGAVQKAPQTPAPTLPAITPPIGAPAVSTPAQVPPERVEADVSTRNVAITSSYKGTEILVFGTVDYSRQSTPESGYYDIVVVVEGIAAPLVARRKTNVGGVWINTLSQRFASLPSYYGIASTRPLDQIADERILDELNIGFSKIEMRPSPRLPGETMFEDLNAFKDAIIRLKQEDGLYVLKENSVAFIGRSLFRTSIALPSNVPVGPVKAKVYLFREGKLLSSDEAAVTLERAGLERVLHDFAYKRPLLYGLVAVALALASGLVASAWFRRLAH